MKSIGVVRQMDRLGRIVLPVEVRKTFGLVEKSPLEVWVDAQHIMLQPFIRGCIFCGSGNDLLSIQGKDVCRECVREAQKYDADEAQN
jgi:transcriptional pleiotropic regulator of transition state genes